MNEYFWFWWVFAIVLVGIAISTGEHWDAALAIAWGCSGFVVFMGMVKKL